MQLGVLTQALPGSLQEADHVYCYSGGLNWNAAEALAPLGARAEVHADLETLIKAIASAAKSGDQVLVMSNGGFGGIHDKLLKQLGAN